MPGRFAIHFSGLALVLFFMMGGDMNAVDIGSKCLYCICKASSHCNTNSGCTKPYFGGYSCGPLSISWAYWADAHAPRLKGDEYLPSEIAFENCVKDIYCATQTVMQYLEKFKDMKCNENDGLTCEDIIKIHIMGGYACNDKRAITDPKYDTYKKCMGESIQESVPSTSDESD